MIKDLMNQIESGDLRYELGYASSTHSLMRRINDNELVQKAQRQLEFDPNAGQAVFQRAKEIYFASFERGFLHPDDNILATYLFLLRHNALPNVQEFIRMVAKDEYPEFRGANGVAKFVAARLPVTTFQQNLCTAQRFSLFHVFKVSATALPNVSVMETVEDDLQRYVNEVARHDELREIA